VGVVAVKRLVVCADGTWKSRDDSSDATNVERLCDAVLPVASDGTRQVARYFPGVGTGRLERLRGGAFGVGLSRNVQECYRFLVQEWQPGDEVHLFGFSRGAFTVRSLAGMVRNVGLLPPERASAIEQAYAHYRDDAPEWRPDGERAVAFRATRSREVDAIRCIGVWDTVGALGVPTSGPLGWWTRRRWGFHDVQLSGFVQHAYHALAVDERRRAFAPALWQADDDHASRQHVEQVWFAGAHSDVGGRAGCGLSDTTLCWMAGKAREAGLELDQPRIRETTDDDACDGDLQDSYRAIYRLQRPLVREIGAPPVVVDGRTLRTHESVHPSAVARHHRLTSPPRGPYAPANLVAHLARTTPTQRGASAHEQSPAQSRAESLG
jgi:uncharacterized protein (DUF2235 family)